MLGCKVVNSSIEQNHKLCADAGDLLDKEQYQRLVS
jgi:predicted nucleic acid-binding Zn ribbon protein